MKKKDILIFEALFIIVTLILIIPFSSDEIMGLRYSKGVDLGSVDGSFWGEKDNDSAGASVAIVGDVNGDGLDDFLVSAPGKYATFAPGTAYLFFGKTGDWGKDINLSYADASFVGENKDDFAGLSIAGAGDVNGDGYKDIIIGAPQTNYQKYSPGKVYVIFGRSSGWKHNTSLAESDASFFGEGIRDWAGISVAGAGDVNRDGLDDVLIGAYGNDQGSLDKADAGKAYLIFGKRTGWLKNQNLSMVDASFVGEDYFDGPGYAQAGFSVAGGGDVNGDGFDDFLIQSSGPMSQGRVFLFFGRPSGWSKNTPILSADASFLGENAGDSAGWALSMGGDVNGDGFDDILIGAPSNKEGGAYGPKYPYIGAGQSYIIFGKEAGWRKDQNLSSADASFIGNFSDQSSGRDGAIVGDVNGDGFDDIVIHAPTDYLGEGLSQTFLVLGKGAGWKMDVDLSSADASFTQNVKTPNKNLGRAVSGGGDINGDGLDDFLVGQQGNCIGDVKNSTVCPGQAFLVIPDKNNAPRAISSVKIFSDKAMTTSATSASRNETIYLEISGTDGNASKQDVTKVKVITNSEFTSQIEVVLHETGLSTGKYIGSLQVKPHSDERKNWIGASSGDSVTISASQDPSKKVTIPIVAETNRPPEAMINYPKDGTTIDRYITLQGRAVDPENNIVRSEVLVNGERHIPIVVKNGNWYLSLNLSKYPNKFVSLEVNVTDGGGRSAKNKIIVNVVPGFNDPDPYLLKYGIRYSSNTNLSQSDASFIGETNSSIAGFKVSNVGDVNKDGIDDIMISSFDRDNLGKYAEFARLFFGRATGFGKMTNLSDADVVFTAESFEDLSNIVFSKAGDVNGDGYSDIVIGVPYRNQGCETAGKAYLIFGKATGWPKILNLTQADASFIGANDEAHLGTSVAGDVDINRDGFDDLIFGAPYGYYGKCYIFYGKASNWTRDVSVSSADFTLSGDWSFGYSVGAAGDINNDGYGDIIVAQESDMGSYSFHPVRIYFGSSSGIKDTADVMLTNSDGAVEVFSRVGDINGDGIDDMVLSIPYNSNTGDYSGTVYLLFGRSDWGPSSDEYNLRDKADSTYSGRTDDSLGMSLSGLGDVNGDGIDDIVIGSNEAIRNNSGRAYLILGKKTGWTKYTQIRYHNDASFFGEVPYDLASYSVSGGDFNGDGYGEILVGAPYNKDGGFKKIYYYNMAAGQVYLIEPKIIEPPVKLTILPEKEKTTALVNQTYIESYKIQGGNASIWIFESNATWLWWDPINDRIEGTPSESDMGTYWLNLRVTDGRAHWDMHNFTLEVVRELPPNHPPTNVKILTLHNDTKEKQLGNGTVELTASATDVDTLQDLNYTWMDDGQPVAWGDHTYAKIPIGHHNITLSVTDGISTVNRSVSVDIIGPKTNPPGKAFPIGIAVTASVILVVCVIAIIVLVTTEVGKYSSILFLAPLYSRIQKEAILDNFTRGKIYQYLIEHPGSYLSLIIRELELNTSVAAFHLNKLEEKGYIRSSRDGLRRQFYPDGKNIPMRPSKLERITRAIRLNPGITQKELAADLGLKSSTVNEYVIKMKDTGLLTVIQKGKKKHLYLFDEPSSEENGNKDIEKEE